MQKEYLYTLPTPDNILIVLIIQIIFYTVVASNCSFHIYTFLSMKYHLFAELLRAESKTKKVSMIRKKSHQAPQKRKLYQKI